MSVLPSQDGSPPLSTDSGSDYYSDESSRASPQSDNDKCQHPPPSSSTDHASNSGLPDLPWIPSSALTSPDHYGGLNPENLATLSVINTVTIPDPKLRMSRLQYLGSSSSKTRMDTLLSHQPMQGSQNPSLSPCPNTIRNGLEGGTLEHIPFDEPLCNTLSLCLAAKDRYGKTSEADIFSQAWGMTMTLRGPAPAFPGC